MGLKCDVRMTKDRVRVLLPDETLGRTTTGRGPVQARTLRALRPLHLVTEAGRPTGFEIPTLAEALAWAEGRAILEPDVKETVPCPRIAAALRRHKALDQVLVIPCTLAGARWYHERLPHLVLSASAATKEEAEALVRHIDPSRLPGWIGVGEIPKGPANAFSSHGVPVAVGT